MSGPRVDPHGGPLGSPDFNTARVALGSWDDLGLSGLNWVARVGGNISFSSVDGSETIPEAVPCPGEGAPSASLPPGTGTERRRRRRRRLNQQALQAGTSSNSDPQLDPKRIKLDSRGTSYSRAGRPSEGGPTPAPTPGSGQNPSSSGLRGRVAPDIVGELSTLRLWLVVPCSLAYTPGK